MTTLLVGFDSAWSVTNSGALVAVVKHPNGCLSELDSPIPASFPEAVEIILAWQAEHAVTLTLILIDQPTIVTNATGQRPVENIVSSVVSRRYGGMQPANTGKDDLFGPAAPIWAFLTKFGGVGDPFQTDRSTQVFETYPVLSIIANGWTLPNPERGQRLPKYNPANRRKFVDDDWTHLCDSIIRPLERHNLGGLARWVAERREPGSRRPRKSDQDGLDACICLLAALDLADGKPGLMVGDIQSGYIVVPDNENLRCELSERCNRTQRAPVDWVRTFRIGTRKDDR